MKEATCVNDKTGKFKKAFDSYVEAIKFADLVVQHAGKLYPYDCPVCGLVHLSSTPPRVNKCNIEQDIESAYWVNRNKAKATPKVKNLNGNISGLLCCFNS